MFEINDKVKILNQRKTKNYEGTCGKEGLVVYIDYKLIKYGVEFPDIKNPASAYGRYYFEECELELVENKIPTLEEIKENGFKCCVHAKTQAEADMLNDFFGCGYSYDCSYTPESSYIELRCKKCGEIKHIECNIDTTKWSIEYIGGTD